MRYLKCKKDQYKESYSFDVNFLKIKKGILDMKFKLQGHMFL